jgi:RHS repeat-associated protein
MRSHSLLAGVVVLGVLVTAELLLPGHTSVTPDGGSTSAASNSSGNMVTFSVANTSGDWEYYTLACAWTGLVTSCTPSVGYVNVGPNSSVNVSVSYATGTGPGTGAVTLTATSQIFYPCQDFECPPEEDSGYYNVWVSAPPANLAPIVALNRHNGSNFVRSRCLTLGAGEGAAIQCGDLLVAHGLPSYPTISRERTLTLLYNSATAVPRPVVAAHVTQSAQGTTPSSVNAQLWVQVGSNWTKYAEATYAGWGGGVTRQVVLGFDAAGAGLATGIHNVEMRITNSFSQGSPLTTIVADFILLVNRVGSEFGAGWHPAGLERLVLNQPGSRLLWVGGDGSAVAYSTVGLDTWVAAPGEFRDTIRLAGGYYTRSLRHGARVVYDQAGRHVQTVSRTNQTTTFTWGDTLGHTRLKTIMVPPGGAGTTYKLGYEGSSAYLQYVDDPAGRRMFTYVGTVTPTGAYTISYIRDPDTVTTYFGHDAAGRIISRTNRLGFATSYSYANGLHVTRVTGPTVPGGAAIADVEHWDEQGLAIDLQGSGFNAASLTSVYTRVYGPRPNVPDNTTFWIDKWGAPTQVTDALGATTTYVRADNNVPARVTEIRFPNNRVVRLAWDLRGNLLEQRDSTSHLTNGQPTSVMRYTYKSANTKDAPDTIIDPEGVRTRFAYNSLGVLATATAANGHVTTFESIGSGPLAGMIQAVKENSVPTWDSASRTEVSRTIRTAFGFNALGNVTSDTVGIWQGSSYATNARAVRRYDRHPVTQHVTTVWDPGNHRVDLVQDLLNRLRESRVYVTGDSGYGAGPLVTRRTYATASLRMDSIIDPRGVVLRVEYDGAGQVIAQYDEAGAADSVYFQPGGLVVATKSRVGLTVQYGYDNVGRLQTVTWPARDAAPAGSVTNTYHPTLGALETAVSGGRKVVRTYYPNGLLRSEIQSAADGSFPSSHYYGYDRAGRRTWYRVGTPGSVAYSDSIWYAYHPTNGTLSTVGVRWRGGASEQVQFTWDALDRLDGVTYPNGAQVVFAYDYDGLTRRVCGTRSGGPVNEDVFNFTFLNEWVDQDRMIRRTTTYASGMSGCGQNNFMSYVYDNVYDSRHQLKRQSSATRSESFVYDSSGNMTRRRDYWNSNPGSPISDEYHVMNSASNRLRQRYFADSPTVGRNYVYDASGNRLSEQPFCPGCNPNQTFGRRDYWYDGLGRTTGTSEYACLGEVGCLPAQWVDNANVCTYDPLGRNISACDNTNPVTLAMDGENVTRTGWDQRPASWTFVHGPGVDAPLMSRRSDKNWSVYSVTDGAGRELAVGLWDGWSFSSEPLYASGPRFAGAAVKGNTFGIERYRNPEMYQLSFFRNRFYDQATGRWTQEDPIGFAGGINLYAYAGNDPVAYTDPFGLCPWCRLALAGARGGAVVGSAVGSLFPGAGNVVGGLVGGALGGVGGVLLGKALANAVAGDASSDDGVGRSIENPGSLEGASPDEVEKAIPDGWVKSPSRSGGGTRWLNPDRPGEAVRVQPGNPADPNPAKRGPYVRVSKDGTTSDPIPLRGNPTVREP